MLLSREVAMMSLRQLEAEAIGEVSSAAPAHSSTAFRCKNKAGAGPVEMTKRIILLQSKNWYKTDTYYGIVRFRN